MKTRNNKNASSIFQKDITRLLEKHYRMMMARKKKITCKCVESKDSNVEKSRV